jgi:hypothetical protein
MNSDELFLCFIEIFMNNIILDFSDDVKVIKKVYYDYKKHFTNDVEAEIETGTYQICGRCLSSYQTSTSEIQYCKGCLYNVCYRCSVIVNSEFIWCKKCIHYNKFAVQYNGIISLRNNNKLSLQHDQQFIYNNLFNLICNLRLNKAANNIITKYLCKNKQYHITMEYNTKIIRCQNAIRNLYTKANKENDFFYSHNFISKDVYEKTKNKLIYILSYI